MQRKIKLYNTDVVYTIRSSRRAKKVRLTMYCDVGLVVTLPAAMPLRNAEQFIRQKAQWIIKTLDFFSQQTVILSPRERGMAKHEAREQARVFIRDRVEHFNKILKFSHNRIFIKAHKRKWGSCSHRKNLNFNYRILFLPQALADYIIIHELCHLQEMSHSKKFWGLIEKILPDWRERQKQLRKYAFGVD